MTIFAQDDFELRIQFDYSDPEDEADDSLPVDEHVSEPTYADLREVRGMQRDTFQSMVCMAAKANDLEMLQQLQPLMYICRFWGKPEEHLLAQNKRMIPAALQVAAQAGHLRIVHWMLPIPWSSDADDIHWVAVAAARGNHLHIIEYLVSRQYITRDNVCGGLRPIGALAVGSLNVLQYLVETFDFKGLNKADYVDYGVRQKLLTYNVACLKYLMEVVQLDPADVHLTVRRNPAFIKYAISNGTRVSRADNDNDVDDDHVASPLELFKYLVAHCGVTLSDFGLTMDDLQSYAADTTRGNHDLISYLQSTFE